MVDSYRDCTKMIWPQKKVPVILIQPIAKAIRDALCRNFQGAKAWALSRSFVGLISHILASHVRYYISVVERLLQLPFVSVIFRGFARENHPLTA